MPQRPATPCLEPGCPQLSATRYCARHQRQYERERGSAAQRGYDSGWRRVRLRQLRRDPTCRICRTVGRYRLATEVDHITRRQDGGSDEPENLQSLCKSCHSRKTMLERRRARDSHRTALRGGRGV